MGPGRDKNWSGSPPFRRVLACGGEGPDDRWRQLRASANAPSIVLKASVRNEPHRKPGWARKRRGTRPQSRIPPQTKGGDGLLIPVTNAVYPTFEIQHSFRSAEGAN